MTADRRAFVFGAGATLIAAPKLMASPLPTIHGDGRQDDWEGLQALLEGRPVRIVSGDTFAPGKRPTVCGGRFFISRPLVVKGDAVLYYPTFIAQRRGGAAGDILRLEGGFLRGCQVEWIG